MAKKLVKLVTPITKEEWIKELHPGRGIQDANKCLWMIDGYDQHDPYILLARRSGHGTKMIRLIDKQIVDVSGVPIPELNHPSVIIV